MHIYIIMYISGDNTMNIRNTWYILYNDLKSRNMHILTNERETEWIRGPDTVRWEGEGDWLEFIWVRWGLNGLKKEQI